METCRVQRIFCLLFMESVTTQPVFRSLYNHIILDIDEKDILLFQNEALFIRYRNMRQNGT